MIFDGAMHLYVEYSRPCIDARPIQSIDLKLSALHKSERFIAGIERNQLITEQNAALQGYTAKVFRKGELNPYNRMSCPFL